jgi:subtilisin family serine protease
VSSFIKTRFILFILLSFMTLSLSGCGGGDDFQRLIQNLFPEEGEETVVSLPTPDTITVNYKAVINSEALISSSNTGNISIGILDDGFNTRHIELADRLVIEQNYDDTAVNSAIVSGVYGDQGVEWSWADHGTGVAGLALGKSSGIAPQAEAVTSLNRSLRGFFDAEEYFQSFSKDVTGRFIDSTTGEKVCVQYIYQDALEPIERIWFPWCVNFGVYHIEKLAEAASFDMPVANLSSTIPFGHYQLGIDLSFNQAKWDDGTYENDWNTANISEFTSLYFYDYNSSYNKIQSFLATNDLVIVVSAGNDGESLTQRQVLDWQALKASSSNPLAQTITNIFFDPDVDSNNNGIIEDSEKGITKGLLFVGALDADNALAWYSNYPGSAVEVQARFIVAPGDLSIATPSLGESGYSATSGTSNSAPLAAGAIALLKVNHPAKSAREIADAILATASKNIPSYSVEMHGQGLLDVAAADAYLKVN